MNAEEEDNQTNYTVEKIEIKDEEETCKPIFLQHSL